ncbi:MAG TPA: urocanate hydratase, partial [Exilispira sp.]|nr:urocanate hydratase [Exilispira sp.]
HDVSGTDSPYRETANIYDGSNVMAEMAVHCFAGNCARGMTLAVLSNGGGVGIGKAINGGFGLVLDGSDDVNKIIKSSISWDVMGGIARRAWARNPAALQVSEQYNNSRENLHITIPQIPEQKLIDNLVEKYF